MGHRFRLEFYGTPTHRDGAAMNGAQLWGTVGLSWPPTHRDGAAMNGAQGCEGGEGVSGKCYSHSEMHGLPLLQIVAVALLILANAFFVAAEFALVSIRDTQVERMLAGGVP